MTASGGYLPVVPEDEVSETDRLTGMEEESQVVPAPQPRRSRMKLLSLAAVGIGFLFLATTYTMNAYAAGAEPQTKTKPVRAAHVPFTHPKFVSYSALPVHRDLSDAPTLCEQAQVKTTCERLNLETIEYWNTTAGSVDASYDYVHALEIQEAFSASADSVHKMFASLALKNYDTLHANAFAVSCQELCEGLVGSFDDLQIPAQSNVGCLPGGEICDIDLSLAAMKAVKFRPDGQSQQEQKEYGENIQALKADNPPATGQWTPPEGWRPGDGTYSHGHIKGKAESNMHEAIEHAISNINMPVQSAVDQTILHAIERADVPLRQLKVQVLNAFQIFPTIHITTIDENGANNFFGISTKGRRLNWKSGVIQTGVQSQAYVSTALNQVLGNQVPSVFDTWYGNHLSTTREEVKRLLNSVSDVLANVDYEYKGDECQQYVYAYVYPSSPWNMHNGRYLYYLCDYYFQVDSGEQIETLVHEGAHHYDGYATDSQYQDSNGEAQTMYGRSTCKSIAQSCAQGYDKACTLAITNADSFCYFAFDAVQAGGGVSTSGVTQPSSGFVPAPSPTTAATGAAAASSAR